MWYASSMKNLIALFLLTLSLPAQQLPIELGYILLGDTITKAPRCPGCGSTTPQEKQDDGTYKSLSETPNTVPGSSHTLAAVWPGSLQNWSVTNGAAQNPIGFGVLLESIVIVNRDGECQYVDMTSKCRNGATCEYDFTLNFTLMSQHQWTVGQGGITITIPGQGPIITTPPVAGPPIQDGQGRWFTWTTSLTFTKIPGCGQTLDFELDPKKMKPHNAAYNHQAAATNGEVLNFRMACTVCPETPTY